jgi:molecular chaperone Hsp33
MTIRADAALRAMTDDATFRVISVSTTETVKVALSHQQPAPSTAALFGDLLTAAVLVRETMAPTHRVQAILKRQGYKGSLVADADPSGDTRGLVSLPAAERNFDQGQVLLQVMRRLQSGRTHQGVVAVPAGGRVSEGLMAYMRESEQVDSLVAVGSHFEGGELRAAGGYLIQLLPGVGQAPLAFMEARLAEVRPLSEVLASGEFTPESMLETLLAGIEHTRLGTSGLRFHCWCSAERLLGALSTLPRADIDDLVQSGETLEITCDYCKKQYGIAPSSLAGLQQPS